MSGDLPEAPGMRQQSINGLRGVHAGSCHAWPLPADATCATVARQVFRDAVAEVGLEPSLLDDCVLMASELAANTLHARAVAGTGGGGDRLVSVASDMGGEPISAAGPAPHPSASNPKPEGPAPATRPSRHPSRRGRSPPCPAAPNYGFTCAASAPAASSSARSSTAAAAGGTARRRRSPGCPPRPWPGVGCRSCTSCPAAGGGTIPPGPGWAAGACAARPSGSRCPRRWRTPG